MPTSIYTGYATARRQNWLPGGGADGDVLTLDANLAPAWEPPAGGVGGTFWPAPFVSSNGVLLDDPRGVPGDKIWDAANSVMYEKVDDSPHAWVDDPRGTVAP